MGISRRRVIQVGGVTAVAAAIPAGQHILWNGKSFEREGFQETVAAPPPGEKAWSNWSGIQHATPKEIAAPATDDELSELIKNSTGRIRPVGTGHSFTGLVPSEGTIVDVGQFSGMLSYDKTAMTATFGAGTRLRQASRALSDVGLGFPNMPDIDVQTFGGSFATATHGAGAKLTAIHDYIRSFRIVTANGEVMDVTADSNPDLFAAGKVSLGALGVITQYTLAVVPAFQLYRKVSVEPIDVILERANAEAAKNRSYEFFYLPHTGYAATLVHNEDDGPVIEMGENADEDTLSALRDVRDQFGWWPWLRKKLLVENLPKGVTEERRDESWRLLSTTRPTKFNEMEYHLPAENGLDALREVIKKIESRKDTAFPLEIRYVAQDDAWLSPFSHGPTISIATHAYHDEPYDYFFSDFEPMYRAKGGRPHWGKLHSLKKADLEGIYPKFNDFLRVRKEMDPEGKFLNKHLGDMFGEQV